MLPPAQTRNISALASNAPASRIRWLVLLLSCTVMFGNYFAFDQVASLSIPLETYLELPTKQDFNYLINAFYVAYSFPNIFLPFIGGALLDRYGLRMVTTVVSILVIVGQYMFVSALSEKSTFWSLAGRLIFGLGGETLSVAQQRITTKWFIGHELALAVGINLSIARLGSVLNDFISPYLAHQHNVPASLWFGFGACSLSFLCTLGMLVIDRRYDRYSAEVVTITEQSRVAEWLAVSNDPVSVTDYEHHRSINSTDQFVRARERVSSSYKPKQGITAIIQGEWRILRAGLVSFPPIFWLMQLVMALLYGTVVPFNTIHSAFLQQRWYPTDPQKAAQVMGVPDMLSAILVPFVGTYADRRGHRGRQILFCSIIIGLVHAILATANAKTLSTPVTLLIILGSSYALLLTFMPCIPLVTNEAYLGIAYGISTSLSNLSWTVAPLIVARLSTDDPTFSSTENMFSTCGFLATAIALVVIYQDYRHHDRVLDLPSPRYRKDSNKLGNDSDADYGVQHRLIGTATLANKDLHELSAIRTSSADVQAGSSTIVHARTTSGTGSALNSAGSPRRAHRQQMTTTPH